MTDPRFQTIRDLIQDDDLERATERLVSLARGLGSEHVNRAINLSARLARLRRDVADGSLVRAEAVVERNQLRQSSLTLLDDLESAAKRTAAPAAQEPISFTLPEPSWQEKIFGISHLRSIGWLRRGLDLARAVCRIRTPSALGTGFLIKGGYILTNHHVLLSMDIANASEALFDYEEDQDRRIRSGHSFRIAHGTWRGSKEFDCAVVRLEDDSSGSANRWGNLELELTTAPRAGDHVTIIQHPDGGPKQIAMTANQVVNIFDHRLQYSTDTLPGSSGSPVFNDAWRVVAIHHAGGNLLKNPRGERLYANEGILIRHVIAALELAIPADTP